MSVNINQYDTLSQATQALKARGFGFEFSVNEACQLVDAHNAATTYGAAEVQVVEFHRFEGESDPSDMTIIYALQTPGGTQGLLIDAFGTHSDPNVDVFVKQLSVPHGALGERGTPNATL